MADDQEGGSKSLTAPYTAFSSIKTAAKNMKEHGLPGRIDRSVLTNFNGSVASQIMQAFKFLGLTTDEGAPTQTLKALVQGVDDEAAWAEALALVLKAAYAPMFTLNLDTASPSQFVQHFRKNYPGADNVSRKSLTFFVNALQDAKIPVSTYILKNKKPRSVPLKKRTVKGAASTSNNGGGIGGNSGRNDPPFTQNQNKPPSEVLLGLMSAEMQQLELDAIWTLIKFFKGRGE